MKKKIIVLWNKDRFVERISANEGYHALSSDEEFTAFPWHTSEPDGIIVLAELAWKGQVKSNFFGFTIIQELRVQYRLKCPIYIYSFMPETFFINRSDNNKLFNLLKAPAHTYISLPSNINKIKLNRAFLSDELLDDIIESLCDSEGLFNEELHRIKNVLIPLTKRDNPEQEIKTSLDRSFSKIKTLFPEHIQINDIHQNLFVKLKDEVFRKKNYSQIIDLVSSSYELIRANLLHRTDSNDMNIFDKQKWKVLFVEDDPSVLKTVKSEFSKRNIECITAGNAEEAFEILEDDRKTNWITVVIADYRLQYSNGKWHNKQGYDILRDIYLTKQNLVSLFALTAANYKALLRIQKQYQMRVLTYSKDDVFSSNGSFNLFAQKVIEEGQKTFELVCSHPTGTSWHNGHTKFKFPLKDYYRAHRLALDYENSEEDISRSAKKYVENVIEAIESQTELASHTYEFQAGLKDEPENSEMLEKFRLKLIGRRIALALFLVQGMTKDSIFYALQKNPKITNFELFEAETNISNTDEVLARLKSLELIISEEKIRKELNKKINDNIDGIKKCIDLDSKPTSNSKSNVKTKNTSITQMFNAHFALSLEHDIPDHLLPEEKWWLEKNFRIDLYNYNKEI